MTSLRRLIADLTADGATVRPRRPGHFVIESYGTTEYSPAVVLLASDDDVQTLLRVLRTMTSTSSLSSAYALLWANLDELFATEVHSGATISLRGGGLSINSD